MLVDLRGATPKEQSAQRKEHLELSMAQLRLEMKNDNLEKDKAN